MLQLLLSLPLLAIICGGVLLILGSEVGALVAIAGLVSGVVLSLAWRPGGDEGSGRDSGSA